MSRFVHCSSNLAPFISFPEPDYLFLGLFHSLANDHYRLREEDEERDEDEEEIEDASTLIEKEKAQTSKY